jgi:hypothetical protein
VADADRHDADEHVRGLESGQLDLLQDERAPQLVGHRS